MDLGNLTTLETIALGIFGVVALIVAAFVLRLLVKISRVLFALGCLLVLGAVGGCVWMVFLR